MKLPVSILMVLLLLGAWACDSAGGVPATEVTIDTLPGGVVLVETRVPRDDKDVPIAGRLDVELSLGAGVAGSDEQPSFGSIVALGVGPHGRIFVLDETTSKVYVLSSEGQLVDSLGRAGDGPGEFRVPAGLAVTPQGEVWVADPIGGRYTTFTPSGEVRAILRRPGGGLRANLIRPWQGAVDSTGVMIDYVVRDGRLVTYRLDPRTGEARDFRAAPDTTLDEWVRSGPSGEVAASAIRPFSATVQRYIDVQGRMWWGSTGRYEIVLQTLAGDTLRIYRRTADATPVSDAERDSVLTHFTGFTTDGSPVGPGDLPAFKPLFRWFVVSNREFVWVCPSSGCAGGGAFGLFDSVGRFLGRVPVEVPLSEVPRPIVVDGVLYGVTQNAIGVQRVIRARLVGGDRQ